MAVVGGSWVPRRDDVSEALRREVVTKCCLHDGGHGQGQVTVGIPS